MNAEARRSQKEAIRSAFSRLADCATGGAPVSDDDLRLLSEACAFDDPVTQKAAQKAAYRMFKAAGRAPLSPALSGAATRAPGGSTPLTESLAFALHLGAWSEAVAEAGLRAAPPDALACAPTLADAWQRRSDALRSLLPGAAYHDLQAAKVRSLADRSAAAAGMRRWREAQAGRDLLFSVDEGVTTYLTEAEVGDGQPEDLTSAFAAALRERPPGLPSPAFEVLLSCDANFLRTHGGPWAVFLPVLVQEGVGVTMLVTGDAAEGKAATETFQELIEANARFRHARHAYARAVAMVPVSVPSDVGAARTFHACARYLHARQLLAATGRPVLVADIDMVPATSLRAFAERVPGPVACPVATGERALLPWRRLIANTVWLDGSPACHALLRDVERYVLAGLPQAQSWTLDQNALTFAAERAPRPVAALSNALRPLRAEPIRNAFERLPL